MSVMLGCILWYPLRFIGFAMNRKRNLNFETFGEPIIKLFYFLFSFVRGGGLGLVGRVGIFLFPRPRHAVY